MAFVVTRLCRDCKDLGCVKACPIDVILEHRPAGKPSDLPNQVYIEPDECIDCAACVPECPWEAIYPDYDVPEAFEPDVALNALVRERRAEFVVPRAVDRQVPTTTQVLENKKRWGISAGHEGKESP